MKRSARRAAPVAPPAAPAAEAPPSRAAWGWGAATLVLGLALYARSAAIGLVGDDWTLLDAAQHHSLPELLTGRFGILGYYRPVSRELWFWLWGRLFGPQAAGYHAVNAITHLGTLFLAYAFVQRWLGTRIARTFVLLWLAWPPTGALLAWVSCAQDLVALFWSVLALWLHQQRRFLAAGVAVLLATLSKETAVVVVPMLAAFEWTAGARGPLHARFARLAPALMGLALALAAHVVTRARFGNDVAGYAWSLRQAGSAAGLPGAFLSTYFPPSTMPGLGVAARTLPVLLGLALVAAALAATFAFARDGEADAAAAPARRRALAFALATVVLGLLPVAVVMDRWRGYFFAWSAFGAALAGAIALARAGAWPARALAAALAVVTLASNVVYRPVESATGAGRHAHVNDAFFRETAELTNRFLAALAPAVPDLRSVPVNMAVGADENPLLASVTGPALRMSAGAPEPIVKSLDSLTVADVHGPLGLLSCQYAQVQFEWQRADDVVRAALARELFVRGRPDVADACLDALSSGAAPQVAWLRAAAHAEAGQRDVARERWRAAPAESREPRTLLVALGVLPADAAGLLADSALAGAATRALADPADAAATAALGRALLAHGAPLPGAVALAVAAGSGGGADAAASLGDACAMYGDASGARNAYARALAGPLLPAERQRVLGALRQAESMLPGGAAPPQ